MSNEELIIKLQEFAKKVSRGEVETEKIIYINNLLQNAFISAYWDKKITYDKLESILYPSLINEDY